MKRLSNRLNRDFSESLMLFKRLQTANDLASFLEIPLGQLLYIAYKTPDDMKYQTFTIPKKNGELRSIASPTGGLKIILEKLKPFISFGASPRASICLALASRAYAFIHRRGYVIPEDVVAICPDVLRHRIGLTYEAEAENVTSIDIINEIINRVDVP